MIAVTRAWLASTKTCSPLRSVWHSARRGDATGGSLARNRDALSTTTFSTAARESRRLFAREFLDGRRGGAFDRRHVEGDRSLPEPERERFVGRDPVEGREDR